VVCGDAVRLRQILINLVGNAVKFTERGEIYVDVRPAGPHADTEADGIEFRISDTGIGIAPERVGTLFQPFTQADSTTTRLYGGSGLGLAISRRLVELMGGQIGVDSTPGAGSVFYFSVPLGRAPDAGLPPAPSAGQALAGRRVLLVAANDRLRLVLCAHLESWGMTVSAANCGEAARTALRTASADVAIIERQLPGVSGDALVRALRADGHDALPIIALSMTHDPGDLQLPLYRAKLLKPVRQARLFEALTSVLSPSDVPQPAPVAPALPLAQQYPLQVLVVDDNAVNRKVAELTLMRMGYRPEMAEDGLQAVDQVAQARAAGRRHDLVFMDVQMPLMDGLEATRLIKSEHGEHAPVIIAMTAAASVEDRNNCFYAGMDDFVSKPVNLKQLEAAIERWGSRLRRRA
jgi:CheY-like chemotaxis protein